MRFYGILLLLISMILLPFSEQCINYAVAAEGYGAKVCQEYEVWEDQKRGRRIPVKIYMAYNVTANSPVVIFSHGLGGSVEAGNYLGEYLAKRGYICLHLQHPGSDRTLFKWKPGMGKQDFVAQIKPAANFENLTQRAEDVRFVLDQLAFKNNSDPKLKGRLNLAKIAIAGHSFGAGTALALAGQSYGNGLRNISLQDARIKAAVYLSPPVSLRGRKAEDVYGQIKIPGLLMTGTEDSSPIGETRAEDRVIPYFGINASDQYLVNFKGGDHMIFSGRTSPSRAKSDEKYHEVINTITGAFLDAYLLDDQKQKEWLRKSCPAFVQGAAEYQFK